MTDKEIQKLADCYGFPFYRFAGDYVSNCPSQPGRGEPLAVFYPATPNKPVDRYEVGGLSG